MHLNAYKTRGLICVSIECIHRFDGYFTEMLAEPKRRTPWSLNPRGKYWSEDKSKFGQKLLESMGWREGLGLGKDGVGVKEHIKVTINSDNKGLGYKPSVDDWIDKNNDYEELLAKLALHHNLNNQTIEEEKVSNLEEISRRMKNRVHYPKLIKAKNLSHCSKKDLISIFPKKRDNCQRNEERNDLTSDVCQSIPQTNGKTYESSKNITEYFRSKMNKLKVETNSKTVHENGIQMPEEVSDILDSDNKIFCNENINTNEYTDKPLMSDMNSIDSNVCKKKSKKNKRKFENNIEISSESELNTNFDIRSDEEIKISKKVKKSKKNKIKEKVGINDSESETSSKSSCDTNSVTKEMVSNDVITNESVHKLHKKAEKNIEKYKIRIPKGYNRNRVSVNESIKNYHKLIAAINSDKALNTTNLLTLKGYGCD